MVPDKNKAALADAAIGMILWKVRGGCGGSGRGYSMCCWPLPFFLRPLCTSILAARSQSDRLANIVDSAQNCKTPTTLLLWLLRTDNRPQGIPPVSLSPSLPSSLPQASLLPNNNGRSHLLRARLYPWYMRPTLQKRWGPSALLARFRGDVLPGDDAKFMPEGSTTANLDPRGPIGKGYEEKRQDAERLVDIRGCPLVRVGVMRMLWSTSKLRWASNIISA